MTQQSNEERIEQNKAQIGKLASEIAELRKTLHRIEQIVTEAMFMIAQMSTTQAQQHGRLVEALSQMSTRQDELERWRSELSNPKLKVPSMRRVEDMANSLAMATKALQIYFNEAELRDLALDMGVPFSSLAGESHQERCHEFVDYLRRRNLFWEMVQRGRKLRPHALWPMDTGPLS